MMIISRAEAKALGIKKRSRRRRRYSSEVNGGASATEPIREFREKLCRKQREQRRKLKLKKASTSEHLSAEISVPGVERDGRIPIALTKGACFLFSSGKGGIQKLPPAMEDARVGQAVRPTTRKCLWAASADARASNPFSGS
jgi:hypothetical protein